MDVTLVKSKGIHVPSTAFVGVSYFRTVGVRRWAGDENRATVESREDHHFVILVLWSTFWRFCHGSALRQRTHGRQSLVAKMFVISSLSYFVAAKLRRESDDTDS